MPVLYLTEAEVRQVLTMDLALEGVETGLRKMALEEAFNNPRTRSQTDQVMLHVLPAAAKTLGVIGFKAYTSTKSGAQFRLTLYNGKTGELAAFMQADYLGQMRTGAASGIATKILSRKESSTIGICGAGRQARTQLLGICKVRKIAKIYAWSPHEGKRSAFAKEMSEACAVEVIPVATAEEAVREHDILVTATSAREPFLKGEWLSPGQHLNVVGSNFVAKAEIDAEAVKRANLICIDSKDQGKLEAGDFVAALDKGYIEWYDVVELGRLVAKRNPGRQTPQDITLFKSLGIGLEDVAVGALVMAKAKEAGIGKWLEL